jgi:hypothetical protein
MTAVSPADAAGVSPSRFGRWKRSDEFLETVAVDEILSAEVGMIDEQEKPQVLVCNEVCGGNHKFIGKRKLPGMVAWVASIPINDGEGGGDLHFMSVCSHDLISRIALADVSAMAGKWTPRP